MNHNEMRCPRCGQLITEWGDKEIIHCVKLSIKWTCIRCLQEGHAQYSLVFEKHHVASKGDGAVS